MCGDLGSILKPNRSFISLPDTFEVLWDTLNACVPRTRVRHSQPAIQWAITVMFRLSADVQQSNVKFTLVTLCTSRSSSASCAWQASACLSTLLVIVFRLIRGHLGFALRISATNASCSPMWNGAFSHAQYLATESTAHPYSAVLG